MPNYHILKKIEKFKILIKQFSLNKKFKIMKDLIKLRIIEFKPRRKLRKKRNLKRL